MTVNQELFQKIHDQITQHPETHEQSSWESSCGTTRCIAGWAIVLGTKHNSVHDFSMATRIHIELEASRLLGITNEQAFRLFDGYTNAYAAELVEWYALKGEEKRDDDMEHQEWGIRG